MDTRLPFIILILLILVPLIALAQGRFSHQEDFKITIPFGKRYDYNDILVTRVVDGDTLKLENGQRVRLIGMDTPEMHETEKLYADAKRTHQDIRTIKALGRRAYEFTKKLVEGKRVRLEFDVEKRDKYGRLLAYVYIKADQLKGLEEFKDRQETEIFLNAEIVSNGFAQIMTIPPNVRYQDYFLKLERQARQNMRGFWEPS